MCTCSVHQFTLCVTLCVPTLTVPICEALILISPFLTTSLSPLTLNGYTHHFFVFHVSNQPHQTLWFELSSYFDIRWVLLPPFPPPPSLHSFSTPPGLLPLFFSFFSTSSSHALYLLLLVLLSLPPSLSHSALYLALTGGAALRWLRVCVHSGAYSASPPPGLTTRFCLFPLKILLPLPPFIPFMAPSKAFLGRPHLTREWMGRRNFSIGRLVQIHLE